MNNYGDDDDCVSHKNNNVKSSMASEITTLLILSCPVPPRTEHLLSVFCVRATVSGPCLAGA